MKAHKARARPRCSVTRWRHRRACRRREHYQTASFSCQLSSTRRERVGGCEVSVGASVIYFGLNSAVGAASVRQLAGRRSLPRSSVWSLPPTWAPPATRRRRCATSPPSVTRWRRRRRRRASRAGRRRRRRSQGTSWLRCSLAMVAHVGEGEHAGACGEPERRRRARRWRQRGSRAGAALVMKVLRGHSRRRRRRHRLRQRRRRRHRRCRRRRRPPPSTPPPPPSPPTLPPLSLRDDQALSFSGNDRGAGTLISARSAGLCVWEVLGVDSFVIAILGIGMIFAMMISVRSHRAPTLKRRVHLARGPRSSSAPATLSRTWPSPRSR